MRRGENGYQPPVREIRCESWLELQECLYGLFSLMPDAAARLDHWLQGHPRLVRRIVIPAELKWEVRDKLDQANISERVLFPGLDGLSAWLKRYCSPRERR